MLLLQSKKLCMCSSCKPTRSFFTSGSLNREEDMQSSSFFMDDKNVQLFGHGLPVEVVRKQPYKVWAVKVLSLVPETSELYVPCGLQFRNHKLQVKTVLEGSVIHMPASYMSLHATQFFMPPDDYHDEFSDKPKFQSSDEELKRLHTSDFADQKDK
jgi:hypothetical protein